MLRLGNSRTHLGNFKGFLCCGLGAERPGRHQTMRHLGAGTEGGSATGQGEGG